jgi:DDE superfamily endonuclease/Winged helix-turn helix
LAPRPGLGVPCKLTHAPCTHLVPRWLQGATAHGFANDLWTLQRIAAVMQVHLGVRSHPAPVWKLLRCVGWSCQVPERRALQRNEPAMAHWQRYTWPAIKKARRLGAHLAFLDESGLLLIPTRRRTWAAAGHTPIFASNDKHDRLSALAALTVSPKRQPMGLYLRFQPHHIQPLDVADFLRALWRHLRGPLIRLWDRGSSHRGPAIEAVCQAHPRLHSDEVPASAPELNPTEQIWHDFKGRTANSLRRDTRELRRRRSM